MTRTPHRLGLPAPLIVALGLLAVPRAVLHDLDVTTGGRPLTIALAIGPLIIWVATGVWLARNPFPALLAVGGVYGIGLAAVHNVFWSHTWGNDPPRLGGNLADRLPAGLEELLMRGATTFSSLFTGLAVGTVCGVTAWAITRLHRPGRDGRDGRNGTRATHPPQTGEV